MRSSDTGIEHLQIGEVAARTELSIKTIRHYDDVGLVVPSARSAGGFRLYTTSDVERLLAIRRMKPLGFSLDEMHRLLAALDTLNAASAAKAQRAQAIAFVAECHARAQDACDKLSRQLAYAHELTNQLADYRS
ncbi:MerR family transcriptional regulator [Mycobacterium sp. 155]|uniref:MerR family transcriptional regulator n=1 Tax=Mycobacterium sp. 155 TaxID=1157943 RepID=UPI0003820FCA|nr:MerR family transcriptional regulator [Mycobacterium sp. 155]